MNILSRLTLRQMKLNRRRTIVTIIGVVISVSMITAVSSFSGSFIDLFKRTSISSSGDYHFAYTDVSSKSVDTIINHENTGKHFTIKDEGFSILEKPIAGKMLLNLLSINSDGYEPAQVKLKEGRLPQNKNEVVVSSLLAKSDSSVYKIGGIITMDLGNRSDSNGRKLDSSDSYSMRHETFSLKEKRTYTVVGVADLTALEKSYNSSFTIIGFLDESTLTPDEKVSIFVSVKNVSKDIFEQSNALYKKIGEGNFSSNRDLLFYSGQSTNTELMLTMYLVTSILIVIIMVGSISLIYNSFAISITERSSDFGMLSSIGATKKQKSKMVLFEAFIVSIVSIPFGIILGLLGIGITFKAISPLLTPMMNNEELKLVVLPCAIIIAIVFSLLTIFISAWIPARRAARATPIDAIRKTLDVKLNSKVVKTSKLTKKLFGFEAELALKNLKRNRRRYRTTLLSLVISLSLFLSAYAFTYYMSRSYSQLNEEINFDVIVSSISGTINEHKRLNEEIMEQNYIEGATCVYTTDATAKVDHSLLTSFSKENSQVGDNLNLTFLSLDENSLNEYSKKVGVDINTLKDINNPSMIFINSYTLQKNKVYTDFKIFKSSNRLQPLNCSFSFYTPDENVSDDANNKHDEKNTSSTEEYALQSFKIAALTDEMFPGADNIVYSTSSAYVVVSQEVWEHIVSKSNNNAEITSSVLLKSSEHEQLTNSLLNLKNRPSNGEIIVNCTDVSSQKEMIKNMFLIINVFIYGFITLISAISIANIFNTISTSIILRKREFAMLKSVGMSPKAFRRMIRFESLFYGFKSVVYGVPIGIAVMYLIYLVLTSNFVMPFTIPWVAIISGVLAVFAIIGFTMAYSSSKLKSQEIIDGLRDENL